MATLNFENPTFPSAFSFTGGSFAFMDEENDNGGVFPASGPLHPAQSNMFIQSDQPTHVHIGFSVTGWASLIMNGTWKAQVFFEKQGQGEIGSPASVGITAHNPGLPVTKSININVNVPALPEGLYRATLMITFETNAGIKLPFAASTDIGLLTVYDAA